MSKSSSRLAPAAASTPTKVSAAEIATANKQRLAKNLPPLAGTNHLDAAASTHTPGPWRAADRVVIVRYGDHGFSWVADCAVGRSSGSEQLANARLIAAAPDMLAALKNITEVDAEELLDGCSEAWAEVNAAIAKAEAAGDRTASTKTAGA